MRFSFLVIAMILFLLAFLLEVVPNPPTYLRGFTTLGLAFFAASFLPGI